MKIILKMLFSEPISSLFTGYLFDNTLTYVFYCRSTSSFYLFPSNILRPLLLHQFDSAAIIHQALLSTSLISPAAIKYPHLQYIPNIHPPSIKNNIDPSSPPSSPYPSFLHFSVISISLPHFDTL